MCQHSETRIDAPLQEPIANPNEKDGDFWLPQRVQWVRRTELNADPKLYKLLVPVCSEEEAEDHTLWYIARIPQLVRICLEFLLR